MVKKHPPLTGKYNKKIIDKRTGKRTRRPNQNIRLFQPAIMLGYRRTRHSQDTHVALLAIKNVNTRRETRFYWGKRVCYLANGKHKKGGFRTAKQPHLRTKVRRIWGKVIKPHGKSGVVKATFKKNLPGQAIGRRLRVYLFPSNI
eukprot:TRINITY_DN2948_c0_g1_i3.p2 TRINITY_DN2948_c0_g1~~TRINITY_DN2948_c0_g1_i3.p2  ORF type:complete len:145 (+),score=11.44 TRINITY_DN2948_c0_g1_i3:158-592(+)